MTLCAHCENKEAETDWTLRACAENRKRRVIPLCWHCDIKLNKLILEFANVKDTENKITKYAASVL